MAGQYTGGIPAPLVPGYGASGWEGSSTHAPFIDGSVITGRVVHVDKDVVAVNSTLGKLASFIVDGAPLQFGHSTVSYALEVEPCAPQSPGVQESRCLLFYGDLKSQIQVGHIVEAQVKLVRRKLVVKRLNNLSTRSTISPAFQIGGSGVLRRLLIALALALVALMVLLVASIANGTLLAGLAALAGSLIDALVGLIGALLVALGPIAVAIVALVIMVRGAVK